MAYFCKDCSYRGKKSGQDGSCPACGSFKLQSEVTRKERSRKNDKLRLIILIGLWAYLIALIAWKLNH